ncbi:unnamed protein product, partial [Tilletia controversa]
MRFTSTLATVLGSSLLLALSIGTTAAQAGSGCTTQVNTVKGSVRSYSMVGLPDVPHSQAWGWSRLAAGNTEICLANLLRSERIFPGSSLTVPIYESNDVDRSQVTRVVLGLQAKGADGWHYWTNLANTRNKAWG